jgi:ATP-dependent Clp protease ATP-binding subunit ClpA
MDHGRLTDHNGKQVNFRNVILIMTTNAGASTGAAGVWLHANKGKATITRRQSPVRAQFRNRLDAIVSAAHLNADVIGMVVGVRAATEAQLADRDVTIELWSQQGVAGAAWLQTDGRAADGTCDPGAHQEAAGG